MKYMHCKGIKEPTPPRMRCSRPGPGRGYGGERPRGGKSDLALSAEREKSIQEQRRKGADHRGHPSVMRGFRLGFLSFRNALRRHETSALTVERAVFARCRGQVANHRGY